MWKKIADWHRNWENEQLAVLEDPAYVNGMAPGWRRSANCVLASLSPIERSQLRDFSLKYRGWRGYAALLKLIVLFTAIGVILHLLRPTKDLGKMIFLANVVGLVCLLTIGVAYFNYRKMVGKFARIFVVLVLCAGVGGIMGASHAAREKGISLREAVETRWLNAVLIGLGAGLFLAVPMAVVGALRNQQYHTLTAQLELDTERERAARALSESRLRLLHAQIEPHFLFNTLGAVQQLAEKDAPPAAALTASLIAFLRASLAEMRSERVSLKVDFGMLDAYLQVMQTRLGARLRYTLILPPALADWQIPSMLLLTLVENAIKHGIEPALRGGEILIEAGEQDGKLRLTVRDSGAGLPAVPGNGEGLDNIGKRIKLLYAGAATLSVVNAQGGGVQAELLLPSSLKEANP